MKVEKIKDWAISLRAAWEQVEGSTTKPWSPERTVKAQECAPRKGRYSLIYIERCRAFINRKPLTRMNSVPYSSKLDDLSEHPVKEVINKVLKNDCKKALDAAAHAQFATTPLRVVAGGTSSINLYTDGTATGTNTTLGKEHIKLIVDQMKERNIPAYMDECYYAIARPATYRAFKNDLEDIKQYVETGFGFIMRGEIGKYEGCRFVEQTGIAVGVGTTKGSAWTTGDAVYFLGEDSVAEAVAVEEEIRGKLASDYGRDKGIAWYALLGFGICHTAAAQARIVMWDSAD